MHLSKFQVKIFEYVAFVVSFFLFLVFFQKTLGYGRTYDDFALVDRFLKSPGDAKLISSYLYAKFHFYPIYFLTHELDTVATFLFNNNGIQILNSEVAKFTNIFLHVTNSFLVYLFIKKISASENDLKDSLIIYLSSLIFLFHPIASQIIFNITTRNESLALFFGLLTFIYCLNVSQNRKGINYFFIALLFFFSLCSKLMTVFLAGLIPLTIFLLNFHDMELKKNFRRNFDIFILLVLTFFIYYYLRSVYTENNQLQFYQNIPDLIFYFFTTLKFYLMGLFFPYEHIYVYATNYDFALALTVSLLFFLFVLFSLYLFIKKKDPIILIAVLWICASLALPVLFGLVEIGFPLISNLAERYQYSSIVGVSIIITWLLRNYLKNIYLKTFVVGSYILVLSFAVFILVDRSKVYIDNITFMSQLDENSPRNVHQYAFTTPLNEAIRADNPSAYKFNLYQYYQVDRSDEKAILEFIRYYIYAENEKGINYFEDQFRKYHSEDPPKKFILARFYTLHEKYEKAEKEIKEIFKKYDEISEAMKARQYVTFIDPPLDDLYFELGKIYFYLEDYQKALDNFKTANVINPMHATALYNGAITLKKLGLAEDAAKLYGEAIKINPFLRETASNMISEAQNNAK